MDKFIIKDEQLPFVQKIREETALIILTYQNNTMRCTHISDDERVDLINYAEVSRLCGVNDQRCKAALTAFEKYVIGENNVH